MVLKPARMNTENGGRGCISFFALARKKAGGMAGFCSLELDLFWDGVNHI